MKKIIKISLMLMCFLILVDNANARCNPLKPSTCVSNDIKNRVRNTISQGFYKFILHNKCSDYIDVSIEYMYSNSSVWNTKHYSLSPGERAHLVNTTNSIVAITAKSSRNSYRSSPLSWNKRQVNMGSTFTNYTYSLTCS